MYSIKMLLIVAIDHLVNDLIYLLMMLQNNIIHIFFSESSIQVSKNRDTEIENNWIGTVSKPLYYNLLDDISHTIQANLLED